MVGPIALHVLAKRYLCAVEPGYAAALTEASALSLKLQGGPLTPEQCRRFERSRFATDAIRVRRWDDTGKMVGYVAPGLERVLADPESDRRFSGGEVATDRPFNC